MMLVFAAVIVRNKSVGSMMQLLNTALVLSCHLFFQPHVDPDNSTAIKVWLSTASQN